MADAVALGLPAPTALLVAVAVGDASRTRAWGLPAREADAIAASNTTIPIIYFLMAVICQSDEGVKGWLAGALANGGNSDTTLPGTDSRPVDPACNDALVPWNLMKLPDMMVWS